MVWPFDARRHHGVRGAGGRLPHRPPRRRGNAAAAGDGSAPGHRGLLPLRRRRPHARPRGSQQGRLRRGRVLRQRQGQRLLLDPAGSAATVRTPNAPYTTRILVRRPAKASHFSGNVVVEMLNPSNQFDLNIGWAMAHRQMVRNGDAWVGITDKPIDVVALKKFDPVRYGSLSFANPFALDDPSNCLNPVTSVDSTSARSRAPRTGSPGTSTARSARWCAAAITPTRSPIAAAIATGVVGTAGTAPPPSTSTASATRRRAATSTTTSTPSTRSTWRATAGTRSMTATSWPWPAAPSSASCRSTSARPPPSVGDPPLQFSNVGVPIIHVMSQSDYSSASPPGARTATRRPTVSVTTRWPAPPTPRPTS